MSNDQIIRSNKPHEVTIPEGSNNARSIRNKVGQREIEQEQQDRVTADKHYADKTVNAGSEAITDQRVEFEHAPDGGAGHVGLEHQESHASERVRIGDTDTSADHRVLIEASQETTHRVAVTSSTEDPSNRVMLPTSGTADAHVMLDPAEGRSDNHVLIPADTQTDNRALLPQETLSDHRAALPSADPIDNQAMLNTAGTVDARVNLDRQDQAAHRTPLQNDDVDSRLQLQAGGTSSQSVSIPADSIQDSFVTIPTMTHTESTPVKVDGHGITDPDRVILESSPDPLGKVLVPVAQPEAHEPLPALEEAPLATAAAALPPVVSAMEHVAATQVTGHVVDKKAEEFRGRVVKLRDEVDQLNRRLDEFKK
jgi:hypothetical protein